MTIGTLDLAVEISNLHDRTDDWTRDSINNGVWRFLGEGCYRAAYLHTPTGVVYKVGSAFSNRQDHETSQKMRAMVWQHVYVPKTQIFDVVPGDEDSTVVAMEFIDAPLARDSGGDYSHPGRHEWNAKGGCADMHRANWLVLRAAHETGEGTFIPIDMGASW